jgi:hypothetical protein
MTRATALIGMTLLIFDSPVFAQSSGPVESLDACFRQSRLADRICEGQTDTKTRMDCFKKTRDAELECLTHISPDQPTAAVPSAPNKNARDVNAQPTVPKLSTTGGEATTLVQPNSQPMETRPAPPVSHWIVSETTSPIDYSPLVTAVLQPTEPRTDGPASLTISCRARRIEFSLQFRDNSAWRNEPQIYFQIADQPPPSLLDWTWSPDGRIATLKNDPVSLLQHLPDGSILTVWIGYRAQQSTSFQLTGLDAVTRKVALACNSAPQQAETSSRRNRNRR